MISSLKKYLHQIPLKQGEIELIKSCIAESEYKLKDFLPEEKSNSARFLCSLLKQSLSDYKNNIQFIDDILALKNEENTQFLYNILKSHKYGLKVLQQNPKKYSEDKNKIFKDLVINSTTKNVIQFVKENKDDVDIDLIYRLRRLDLKLIKLLENEGYTFDENIVNTLFSEGNLSNPKVFLNYIKQFKDKMDAKTWDSNIITLLQYYNGECGSSRAKHQFKDSIFLLMELKEPQKYRWGSSCYWENGKASEKNELKYPFGFNNALSYYIKPNDLTDRYIDINNANNLNKLKEFIKENDIHFQTIKYHTVIISTFIDELKPSLFEEAIKNDWSQMFKFDKNSFSTSCIFSSLQDDIPLFKNEKIRRVMLKEYFAQPQYRFNDIREELNFLKQVGITHKSPSRERVLESYFDILSLDDLLYIEKTFNPNTVELERKYLESKLASNNKTVEKKIKI